jgi:phenylpropionate dioxygenase-like ring-hydroxylating dioxygenase large terminal subunit
MLEEQDWEKIRKRVEDNKFVQSHTRKTEEKKEEITEREERKKQLHQDIRDYNDQIRLLNGKVRSAQVNINAQDRAILARQKRIAEIKLKAEKIREGIIERQEEIALKRKRREFRQKVLKNKVAEIWN